jgi:hypothetical protein
MPESPPAILKKYECDHIVFEWADASTVGRIREEGMDALNTAGPRHYGPRPLWGDVKPPYREPEKAHGCCSWICCERAIKECQESLQVLKEKLTIFDISNRREVMNEAEKVLDKEAEKHRGNMLSPSSKDLQSSDPM